MGWDKDEISNPVKFYSHAFYEVTIMMTEDELEVFINELLEGDTDDS
jgi:hypothetical protein